MFVNGNVFFQFKADSTNINFPTQVCAGNISIRFSTTEFRDVFLNENVYGFSFDYNSIDKSDMFNIHEYLTNKNNIK